METRGRIVHRLECYRVCLLLCGREDQGELKAERGRERHVQKDRSEDVEKVQVKSFGVFGVSEGKTNKSETAAF